jgi:hypothetical protein
MLCLRNEAVLRRRRSAERWRSPQSSEGKENEPNQSLQPTPIPLGELGKSSST